MSLADCIEQETATSERCKTCDVLAELTDEDRADFAKAAASNIPGAALARAVTRRLAQTGIGGSVGEASVRKHIDRRHP